MRINARGLPHSEIPGSKPVCGLPELIAAYHVLHRHLAPRHSPYALSSLTIDMRTNVVCRIAFASYPAALILFRHTACVLWSEKTTVCRIFNCQRAPKPFRRRPVARDQLTRAPLARRASLKLGDPLTAGDDSVEPAVSRVRTFYPTPSGHPIASRAVTNPTARPSRAQRPRHSRTKQSGEYRARTGDLLVANQALSQLS